jgi:hypothetical protein
MTKRIIDELNDRLPALLYRDGVAYQALFGKSFYTPNIPILSSSDYNCGAIAHELEYLRGYIDFVTACYSLEQSSGTYLDDLAWFFLSLERAPLEGDEPFFNRIYSLLRRAGNLRWQTSLGMLDVFSYYFDKLLLYLEEDYIETTSGLGTGDDILANGGFELGAGNVFTSWNKTETGSSVIVQNTTQMLEAGRCLEMQVDASNSNVSFNQAAATLSAAERIFHIYYQDENVPDSYTASWQLSVQRSSDSYYYNFATNQFQASAYYQTFAKVGSTNGRYAHAAAYVSTVGMGTLTLTFTLQRIAGAAVSAYQVRFDRAMFGLRKTYPSAKMIVIASGSLGGYMPLARNTLDNYLDRGECGDATGPALNAEAGMTLTNITPSYQQSTQHYLNAYSIKLLKAGAGACSAGFSSSEGTASMHGLTAGQQYSFSGFIYCPTASGPSLTSKVYLNFDEYYSASWHTTQVALSGAKDAWLYATISGLTLNASTTGVRCRVVIDSAEAANVFVFINSFRVYDGTDMQLQYLGFFDNDYIGGEGGGYNVGFYTSLLNIIRSAGVKGEVEFIARNFV